MKKRKIKIKINLGKIVGETLNKIKKKIKTFYRHEQKEKKMYFSFSTSRSFEKENIKKKKKRQKHPYT